MTSKDNLVTKVRDEKEMRELQTQLAEIYQKDLSPVSKGRVRVAIDLLAYLLGETDSFNLEYALTKSASFNQSKEEKISTFKCAYCDRTFKRATDRNYHESTLCTEKYRQNKEQNRK